jgi:predicted HTH domain antitoxin
MEDQVIILAKISQLKDMQIYLLKEEKKLKKEYKRLQQLEEERKDV